MNSIERRVLLTIDQFKVKEIDQLLIMMGMRKTPNRPEIFQACEAAILKNIKLIKHNHLPSLFFSFADNGFGSPEFYKTVSDIIINSIFLYDTEQLTKLVWSFGIKAQDNEVFFKKFEEKLHSDLDQFSFKEISVIVWGFSEAKKGTSNFFLKIEEKLIKDINKMSIKDLAYILWGYTNKMTLNKLFIGESIKLVLEKYHEADLWDSITIIWAFSRMEGDWTVLQQNIGEKAFEFLPEMNKSELISCLKSFIELNWINVNKFQIFFENLEIIKEELSVEEILILLKFISQVNFKIGEKIENFAVWLWNRIEKLKENQRLGIDKEKEIKSLLNDPEYYLQNKKLAE